MKNKTWQAVAAIVGVAAFAFAVGMATRGGDDEPTTSAGRDVIEATDATVNTGTQIYQYLEDGATRLEREAIEKAKASADTAPEGNGPWPFTVVKTGDLGLRVRSTNVEQAVQFGGMRNLTTAYAWCQEPSPFDPVPGDPNGAMWLLIGWDNLVPSETDYSRSSSPAATGRAWIYKGLVVPDGHSGAIPTCK